MGKNDKRKATYEDSSHLEEMVTFRMSLKCTECGSTLKKESVTEDQVIICPSCDAQYKLTSTPDGKHRLEEFSFGDNDPGEL